MNAHTRVEELSNEEFRKIVAIAKEEAGLAIPASKRSLVQSRVTRRMREIGLPDGKDYFSQLENDPNERRELIYVLTTNVSHFYREEHHFEFIRNEVLSKPDTRDKRFWSAGCSNGQEPYTLAFEVLQAIPDAADKNILILATDIDPRVVAKARSGVYSEIEIDGVPAHLRPEMFTKLDDGSFRVRPEITELVRFNHLNLNAEWPMRGQFDLIMCRNVVIYFDDNTQRALWPRFGDKLVPNGLLMLGHSERIHPIEGSGFETIGVTTYRKL